MNYHEKNTRSMSSSLPSRSIFPEGGSISTTTETIRNYTIFTGNIKNPPKMTISDDGSGTASNPKNIINSRRRSESFAIYSGQEYFAASSGSPNGSQNSFNEAYFNEYLSDESAAYFSPDNLHSQLQQQHSIFPHNLNVDKKIVLYKTEMCRTFEETGTCKYGTKCQFAHEPNEIRNIPRHPRYKTEICKTFWQLGNCPYGKRCCFIHTENELRDPKKPVPSVIAQQTTHQQQGTDIYGSVDLTIAEDVNVTEIQSRNSSRSASPSRAAEDLKKSISNIGTSSIFNNLRRKSIFDDKIDELAMLIGSNCSINQEKKENDSAAPNSEDPEFKTSPYRNQFELWSCDDELQTDLSDLQPATSSNSNKFTLFDKSPGSRTSAPFSNGIWSKGSTNTFIPNSEFYKNELKPETETGNVSSATSGTSSSKSQLTNHQQLLIDMLNLLDSA